MITKIKALNNKGTEVKELVVSSSNSIVGLTLKGVQGGELVKLTSNADEFYGNLKQVIESKKIVGIYVFSGEEKLNFLLKRVEEENRLEFLYYEYRFEVDVEEMKELLKTTV